MAATKLFQLVDRLFRRRELTLFASRNAVVFNFSHALTLIENGRMNADGRVG